MLAKFTPFGEHDSGKTTLTRVLTYLLYKHANPNYYVHFQRATAKSPVNVYPSSSALPLYAIFNNNGKTKSVDFRISFTISIPTLKGTKDVRIAIATPSDKKKLIKENWDLIRNRNMFQLSANDYIEPHISISPCRLNSVSLEECHEQNRYLEMINFIYWFRLPMDEYKTQQINDKQWSVNLKSLYEELEEHEVFTGGRHTRTKRRMTKQQKYDAMKLALLIKDKIFELANMI